MAKNNDISIPRMLISIEKFLIKSTLIFFLLSGILLIVTINDAGIDANSYDVPYNTFEVVDTFTIDGSGSYQYYMFPIENQDPGEFNVIIEKLILGGQPEVVLNSTNQGFVKFLTLEFGEYQVRARFIPDLVITGTSAQMAFGSINNLNLALFGITVLFLVIFGISIGFFFALLPFTIFAIIMSAVMSPSPKYPREEARISHRQSRREAREQARERNVDVAEQVEGRIEPSAYRSTLNLFDPESYISRFTKVEWILFGFMMMFLFVFFIEFEGAGLFMTLIILAIIIYRVNEREKTKHRIVILLSRTKETSIPYLATQTGKKSNYVKSVIQMMILDENYPISMDIGTGIVRILGDLSPYMASKPVVPAYIPDSRPMEEQQIESTDESISEPIAPLESEADEGNYTYCSNCGEQLPEFTKYCFICGTKIS